MKQLYLKARQLVFLLSVIFISFISTNSIAQTTLAVGDISIIGFNANAPDGIMFVNWVALAPNTEIRFTDNGFNSTSSSISAGNYREQEQYVVWKNSTGSTIPIGTKITIAINAIGTTTITNLGSITSITNSSNGIPAVGMTLINTSGDQIFAFQGVGGSNTNSLTATFTGTIIAGLGYSGSTESATGWLTTGTINGSTSYLPNDLTGTSQIFLGPNVVAAQYNGDLTGQSITEYKSLVANPNNWTKVNANTVTYNTASNFSVASPPSITLQPENSSICAGTNTTFGITATNASTYTWQVSTNAGGSFSNLSNTAPYSNASTATLIITGATRAMHQYQYRCIVTGSSTPDVTSNAVTLTVNSAPSISIHPTNKVVQPGNSTTFSVTAANASGYQWQVDQGAGFNNVAALAPYSGTTSAVLTITGATTALNGYKYQVVVNGECNPNATSSFAALTVGTLPVELQGFNLITKSNGVDLIWTTVSEKNNDVFILERSANGIDFIEIARLKGHLNSSSVLNYSYIDRFPSQGINYYRLKQKDLDGVEKILEIKDVKFSMNKPGVSVYPNPVKEDINFTVSGYSGKILKVELVNLVGVKVYEREILIEKDKTTYTVQKNKSFPSGNYVFKLSGENGFTSSSKVVVLP